jgi:NAD(P)-dependent dehydrogenase (short-subunit alcohol dehydrogenase family)
VYPAIDPLTKSDCTGKVVLITGASRGFGRAIAVGYALAGASRIAIAARSDLAETTAAVLSAAKAARRLKPDVLQLSMDVADAASVCSAAAKVETAWGRLDIIVSNAGYMASFALLLDGDEESYRKAWDVNFWGTYNVSKAFLPLMLKGGDKTIITISSLAAHFAGPGGGSYHVSKLALARLTEQIYEEYKDQVSAWARLVAREWKC